MKRILFLLCTSVFALGLSGTGTYAQSDNACSVIGEEIIPLRVPNFDNPILWKRVMGVDGPDIPVDLISLADGGFVVVGHSAEYSKDKGMGPDQLYLARLDINGKLIWEKRDPVKGFENVAAGIAVKDRLAVLNGISVSDRVKAAQLNFYDGLGAVKSSKIFSDEKYDLIPEGLIADAGKQTMTLAFWAVNRKDANDNFTLLKKLSFEGKELSSRQYLPGVPNRLETFKKLANGDLIGSGQIQEAGVKSGWIFLIDGDSGDLKLQRPYSRGFQSNLRGVAQDNEGNFILVGDSVPTDAGLRAAWVMKVDRAGNPVWQKYIQGKYAYSGKDVSVQKDGRILALVNARPTDKDGGRQHIRIMTFTPQGKLDGDEAMIEGANSQGMNLLVRDRSRIIAGVTSSGLASYATDNKSAGWDLWVLGLPKLSNFNDPCGGRKNPDSFDDGF